MLTIVSAKSQRLLRILNKLPKNYGFLSYESIQRFNSCSINTAYADAKFIVDQWERVLDLKLVDKGIITFNKSDSDFEYARKSILRDEFELHLIWNLFINGNQTTCAYASMLSCSESHFRKTIKVINEKFKPYGIFISYSEKTKTWSYEASSPVMGAQMIARIVEICGFEIPKSYAIDYQTYLKMYRLNELCVPEIMGKSFNVFHACLKYYLDLKSKNPEQDFHDICYERAKNLVSFATFKAVVELELQRLRDTYPLSNIEFKNGDISLYTYAYFLYMRDSFYDIWIDPETGRYETTLHRLQNENAQLIATLRKSISKIDDHFSINLSQFINEIIIWVYINVDYAKIPSVKKILILSDLGDTHINIMKNFIEDHFRNVTCFDEKTLRCKDLSTCDLIITNSKQLVIQKKLEHLPTVILSDILTIDEITTIYCALFNIRDKRRVYDR